MGAGNRGDEGMGAMGKLSAGERYVVAIQIKGPKSEQQVKAVNDLITKLKNEMGAEIKISVTGSV